MSKCLAGINGGRTHLNRWLETKVRTFREDSSSSTHKALRVSASSVSVSNMTPTAHIEQVHLKKRVVDEMEGCYEGEDSQIRSF